MKCQSLLALGCWIILLLEARGAFNDVIVTATGCCRVKLVRQLSGLFWLAVPVWPVSRSQYLNDIRKLMSDKQRIELRLIATVTPLASEHFLRHNIAGHSVPMPRIWGWKGTSLKVITAKRGETGRFGRTTINETCQKTNWLEQCGGGHGNLRAPNGKAVTNEVQQKKHW